MSTSYHHGLGLFTPNVTGPLPRGRSIPRFAGGAPARKGYRRLHMNVVESGPGWVKEAGGLVFDVQQAPCGLGCRCDAIATLRTEKG